MAKFLIVLAPIIASAFADDGYAAPAASYGAPAQAAPSYNAPDAGYGAPDSGYGVPDTGYGAPDTGYGAPNAGYGAPSAEYGPPGYDAPASGYGAVIEEEGAGLGSTLTSLLPLFLAVFAALIVAQLFAPLLLALFGAKTGFLGMLLAPLGNIKIDLINTFLAPFNLVIASFAGSATAAAAVAANTLAVAGTNGRSFSEAKGFAASPETVDLVTNMLYKAIKEYSS